MGKRKIAFAVAALTALVAASASQDANAMRVTSDVAITKTITR